MRLDKLSNSTVEQTIDFISLNNLDKDVVIEKIEHSKVSNEDKELLIQKINTAYNRINEPLEASLKLFYLFAPFGLINLFINSEDVNFKRFKEYRYLKKIRDYYIFSTIGMVGYLFIAAIAGIYTRYYS